MVAINMEPVAQFRPTPPCPSSFHGDRQRLPLSNKYHQTFTACYSRIHEGSEQTSPKARTMPFSNTFVMTKETGGG